MIEIGPNLADLLGAVALIAGVVVAIWLLRDRISE